jgi:hypothetical protein
MDTTTPQVGQHWRLRRRDSHGFVTYDDVVVVAVSEDGRYVRTRLGGFPWLDFPISDFQRAGQYIRPNWFWRLFGFT